MKGPPRHMGRPRGKEHLKPINITHSSQNILVGYSTLCELPTINQSTNAFSPSCT